MRIWFSPGVSESANQPPTEIAELQARLAAALAERDEALSQVDRLQHLLHRKRPLAPIFKAWR